MRPKIAIFEDSFNPPGIHHRAVAEALVPHFDKIIVIPRDSGPDTLATNDVESCHRAALVDITFRRIPKVEVDLSDLERASCTNSDIFETRYGQLGELWHVIGAGLGKGTGNDESAIQFDREQGHEMRRNLNYCVMSREGDKAEAVDLPPKHQLITLPAQPSGTSSEIRERIFKRLPYASMLTPDGAAYVERYGLYRGRIPAHRTRWQTEHPRLLVVADEHNPRSMALAATYRRWEDAENPANVLVIGGDGTMLGAIRAHWRRRIPFIGVNEGHLGFLLNEQPMLSAETLPATECVIRLMPMLFIEIESPDGTRKTDLAFNDAWMERSTSQSTWLEVEVNGQVRIPKLVADGALVCTAAGSTAYARSMGVAPLLADTPGWIVVGSNVMSPPGWKSALLAPEASVNLRSIGSEKRPLNAFVGGRALGPAVRLYARQSRIAPGELVFAAQRDMAEKISLLQFPLNVDPI